MNGKLWRSRWAAIGAAVAVTLGGGGLLTVSAASSPSAFVAISPVRVFDSRLPQFGGALTAGSPRNLLVTGIIPTVGAGDVVANAQVVPAGATAIVANVTAVTPTSGGFVSVRPATVTDPPSTSNLNVTAGAVVPNSVTVEVPTSGPSAGQIQLWFGGSPGATTQLLVDIVGYYQEGAAGPQGPAGPSGPTGATGARGFSAWDVIPSGVTVTGDASFDTSLSAFGPPYLPDAEFYDFPFTARADLTDADIGFGSNPNPGAAAQGDLLAGCTGSNINPTAPPGKVCIYVFGLEGIDDVQADALDYQPRRGFSLLYTPAESIDADVNLYAVWAYTAP